eukprot:1333182-Amorphochlora_amoeboformis.AAC.1
MKKKRGGFGIPKRLRPMENKVPVQPAGFSGTQKGAALAVGSPSIAHIRRIPLRIGRNLPSFRQEWSKSPRDWKNYVKYEDILNADPLREGQGSAISQGKESDLSDLDRIGITSDDKDSEWAIRFDDAKGGEVTMILMHESHAPGYRTMNPVLPV